jgi:hypothetical protein
MADNASPTNKPTPCVAESQETEWTHVCGGLYAQHVLKVGSLTLIFKDHKDLQYFD